MVHIGGRKRRRDGWGKFALIAESFAARLRYSGASLGHRLASTSAGGPAPPIAAWLSGTYHSSYCDRYRDLHGDCARRHRNDDRLHRQGHFRRNQSR